jgi:hypothetical protein
MGRTYHADRSLAMLSKDWDRPRAGLFALVVAGKQADLMVVKGNPAANIADIDPTKGLLCSLFYNLKRITTNPFKNPTPQLNLN